MENLELIPVFSYLHRLMQDCQLLESGQKEKVMEKRNVSLVSGTEGV